MDADLQDPPEVVTDMLAHFREGYDIVHGVRRKREKESVFRRATAFLFYRVLRTMVGITVPVDAGDFRLMSRRVVLMFRALRETNRFVRGMVAWVGFRQTTVLYDRKARFAGETHYPLRKMLKFAFDGITGFSIVPLRIATLLGFLAGIGGLIRCSRLPPYTPPALLARKIRPGREARLGGTRIGQPRAPLERIVEQLGDAARILLAIFVESHHPFRDRARHSSEGRCMLAEVSRQPDNADERILGCKRFHDRRRPVDGAIVAQEQLGHLETATGGGRLSDDEGLDLSGQRVESPLALIDRHHHGYPVDDIGRRLEILYHSPRQLTETASAAVAGFLRPVAGGAALLTLSSSSSEARRISSLVLASFALSTAVSPRRAGPTCAGARRRR
jgi:hypothetical protein